MVSLLQTKPNPWPKELLVGGVITPVGQLNLIKPTSLNLFCWTQMENGIVLEHVSPEGFDT